MTRQHELPCPEEHLRLHPLLCNRPIKTKKYGPNERTIKTLEKELSDKEIDNLSDAELKTLLIRMLTKMVDNGHKIEEEVKGRKMK